MSYNEVGDLRFFSTLVDSGSLTAAARSLGTSPAAVSRRLARIEARLGSMLVIRNTRHFGLSETGRLYYERGLAIVADIDHLEEEISSSTRAPKGTLAIGAPVELGRRQIAPFIAAFSARHPGLNINLALASEGVYDVSDSLDVVLRLGLPDTPGAVVTRLASTMRVLCASPDYIRRRSLPRYPRELVRHDCLCLRRNKTMALLNRWAIGNDTETEVVTVEPRLSTTNAEIIHDWALSGQGIAYKLLCDVYQDLEEGKLVRIFPDLQGEKIDLYAVLPSRQHTRASVRAFMNELRPYIRTAGFMVQG
ncbi:LysR family transcriptional regulator [Komagataeibacter medellinensis]|uniref:LysR family transcriptional regulator n=1 Tax=Komagataeibacter medellinensis TaxID=1177712 RepID=A0ABQ6VSA4_9PROT|nr:LysR family transcriptional regulator [Komagataeibacter medellinensis]KAB8123001.1 LysR family transcriptional regulator [Komagataeibacter medellinensis]